MANDPKKDGTSVDAPLEWLAFGGLPLLPTHAVWHARGDNLRARPQRRDPVRLAPVVRWSLGRNGTLHAPDRLGRAAEDPEDAGGVRHLLLRNPTHSAGLWELRTRPCLGQEVARRCARAAMAAPRHQGSSAGNADVLRCSTPGVSLRS